MKKTLTILVIIAIVLSLSASAFADNGGIKVTKDPTDEYHFIGETAAFVANARKYSTGTLIINNVHADMEGYRFFCTFSNANGAENTTEAVLHIIYQGKELDIPAGLLVDLVPGIQIDNNGRPYIPTYWY